ncbi:MULTISPECIES: penicillin-binding protein 1A [unclassified Polaribacter]|uniref:penicillin-binding protein 1A n=1 Tax=unclassified Polaribacter TaxID=196858 RepID=UPI001C4E957C|nr:MULTISPECIES: transglycosylase domain-containing protein [unclassified Polaribacter]QXP65992.1 transglycosylase domain-containing protein [Polaribacter sp. AHE13PA]QXP71478.1 transglycosylase domain-containing protein [Polaribacter sp. R2A056_3_33]
MTQKKTTDFKKYIKWFWLLVLGGFASILLLFLIASWGGLGKLPTFEELENPENNLATEIISSDGKTLGKYATENRTPIKFTDLPDNLIKALVATEDERFFEHSGIDFKGTARAILKPGSGGASTITQQLAKMLFTGRASRNIFLRVGQKVKEWVVATKLERQYTKNEILTMYLNKYDFINQAVGIRSAARIYFGKEPKELEVQESAMLVGMLKNASLFNPLRRAERVKNRRNVVLKQMNRSEFISEQEKDSLQALDLGLDIHKEGHSDGSATYFRTYLQKYLRKWVEENPKPNGEEYNIFRDGLKIYVTIDSRMQKYAEEAIEEHMSNLQSYFFTEQKRNKTAPFYDIKESEINRILERAKKNSDRYKRLKIAGKSNKYIDEVFKTKTEMSVFSWKGDIDTIMSPMDSVRYYKYFLRAGLLSIEPQSGHIKAWVGGVNNKHFKYDAVAQQKRQVGSTFKPFVYAAAINQLKLSPCDEFPNIPYTIPKGKYGIPKAWTPENASKKYGGMLSLKDGLAGSVNTMSARLIDMVGPENVVRLAKSAGIESDIPANPSIALGAVDLSLLEMVSAYATFANQGLRVAPMILTRIEDKNGTVLEEFTPETKEVLSEESAYVVLDLLKGVTQSGSGVRLRLPWKKADYITGHPYKFTNPIAGKTGTTQNQSDGWFMGIVPNLATGVWTGGEDRATHFAGIAKGQGATMALPSWALYMQKVYADETLNVSKKDFEKPENLSINIDCNDTSGDEDTPIDEDTDF